MKRVPTEIRKHWQRVVELGCIVTGSKIASIHHVHGGSIIDAFGYAQNPGMAQRQNHWLVIPLHPQLHYLGGGIDNGMGKTKSVVDWEANYGRQSDFLGAVRERIRERYGYDIYERAGVSRAARDS